MLFAEAQKPFTYIILAGCYAMVTSMYIHHAHFVSAASPDVATALQGLPPFPAQCTNCLISGPPRSGKTNLLFHFALRVAQPDAPAIYICNRERLEDSPFLLPPGTHESATALQHVKLKYVSTVEDVQRVAGCLHLMEPPPAALLVDSLSSFDFGTQDKRARDIALIRTLAQLHEAAQFIRQVRGSCPLVVVDDGSEAGPAALYLYQKWFPLVLVATGQQLQVLPQCTEWLSLGQLATTAVRYTLGRSYLSATALVPRT